MSKKNHFLAFLKLYNSPAVKNYEKNLTNALNE
jgi:hypothetical protein